MKLRVEEILFPFDFSAQCLLAVPFVRALALRLEAKVTVLGAVPPVWDITPVGSPILAGADIAEWGSELQSRLDQALTDDETDLYRDRPRVGRVHAGTFANARVRDHPTIALPCPEHLTTMPERSTRRRVSRVYVYPHDAKWDTDFSKTRNTREAALPLEGV